MDEEQFKAIKQRLPEIQLSKTKIKLKALKEELPVLGEIEIEMSNNT